MAIDVLFKLMKKNINKYNVYVCLFFVLNKVMFNSSLIEFV